MAVLFCLNLGFSGSGYSVIGQRKAIKPVRILIDASKDGGAWWFPQWRYFDENQDHQGKAFADMLRQHGAEVEELPRGEPVTIETLRGFDLVVRLAPFFAYSASEANAYRDSVAAGTRVLLIGADRNRDPIAEVFGLEFERRSHFTALTKWVRHPFTAGIDERDENLWSGVVRAPKEAVSLGWIGRKHATPVLGFLPFGKGHVVFMGRRSDSGQSGRLFAQGLIKAIAHHSLTDLVRRPATHVITAEIPPGPEPILLEPLDESELSQTGEGGWRFDWDDVPGADQYEIVIWGPSASVPLVHLFTHRSEFNSRGRKTEKADGRPRSGYIAAHNLRGWTWKVRARLSGGIWGAWSAERRYNILMRNR